GSGIWGCFRVRNHEKTKKQQGSVLHPVKGDAHGLTQPIGAAGEQRSIEDEEGIGHVAPSCPVHDQSAETGEQKSKERLIPPLAWGNPYPAAQKHNGDQTDVRGIEEMFDTKAQNEFAGNGENRGRKRPSR